ncbi:hypothetical protein HELRODRAFT_107427 [Helobdella robusta]|uniref:Uncharacterized protein n=1 Tax=Helobdella robusta TaxID=6412 RepID=T1EEA4_HELRO|nr:hypothetical protein HELRODRAFT_107427 [Helobdella robusta]ESN96252.1 hypothetical protein HELRODRAFT_107427 [Helobdella robusta]
MIIFNNVRRSSFILFIIFCLVSKSYTSSCRDVNNKPIDWFIIYKLPALKNSPNKLVRKGVGQVYMDSNNVNFQLLNISIAEQRGPVYYSLANIYSGKNVSTMYAMYNDQTPYETSEHYGHTKGVLNFDRTSGFWMVHSIPKFPPSPQNKYDYPKTATKFGQTLLCVTFNYSFLDQLGVQLRFNNPKIYNYSLPADMRKSNPNMVLALNGSSISDRPYFSVLELRSLQGENILSFAKNAHFNKDLYSNLVATRLQSNLMVEAWRNGRGGMDSECNMSYKVENIESIKLLEMSFNSTSDHSKWAIATSLPDFKRKRRTSTWTCVGDINRQVPEHQLKRGGGTLCLSLQAVWKNFKQMVTTVEQC